MPHYMIQTAYTPDAWAGLIKSPQDRAEGVRPAVEALDGKLISFYMAFGEYDVVAIAEMPDNVSAAGFAVAASAGGAVKTVKTTPLMTVQEGMEAMGKARQAGYRPPS